MSANEGESSLTQDPSNNVSSTNGPTVQKQSPDVFLIVCRCFSVVTCLAAILCIVVNVISAVRSFKNGFDIFDGVFRCYAVVIAIFVVVAETEWEFITRFSKVLIYWPGRGMLQIFVAVMTKAYPGTVTDKKTLLILQSVGSYTLLGCGVIYVILGVLCVGYLKRARQNKGVSAVQARKDLDELESRREELEARLIADRVA